MRRRTASITWLVAALVASTTPAATAGVLPELPGMTIAAERAVVPEPPADDATAADAPSSDDAAIDETPGAQPAVPRTPRAPGSPTEGATTPSDDEAAAPETEAQGQDVDAVLDVAFRVFYSHGGNLRNSSLGSFRDCPRATTCDAYRVGKSRWPTDATGAFRVGYRYNDSGRPASRAPSAGESRRIIAAGAAEWNRWNSNIAFTDVGTTDARFNARGADGGCDDDVNVVTWRTMPPDVLGMTAICYDTTTYVIRDVDTAFNAGVSWGALAGPTEDAVYDLRSIAVHEFGHWVSLFDLRFRKQSGQTMYAAAETGETRKRTLALGDVLGAQAAYPCGSGDSCPRTGIVDD